MLDPQLVTFVRRSLRSIWALELLLYLRRAAPRSVSVQDIVRDLRATSYLVRRIAGQLMNEGLVTLDTEERVRFQPSTPDLERLCEMTDTASRDRPIALRDAIVAAPNDKLRTLADAFRFGHKDKEK